ncbi:hypothetical protein CYMTET_55374 [Cymbomonas tetramitiformis]|uniref:Uncharacterized protein n=1 Tax=Cymbomonas tetramitiformis TaxID=36881 RepID=A0AAE0EN28_9CHLO|nr:hypothetical protein CYMTET_55374 [Cymbomonas tetramitiformis]
MTTVDSSPSPPMPVELTNMTRAQLIERLSEYKAENKLLGGIATELKREMLEQQRGRKAAEDRIAELKEEGECAGSAAAEASDAAARSRGHVSELEKSKRDAELVALDLQEEARTLQRRVHVVEQAHQITHKHLDETRHHRAALERRLAEAERKVAEKRRAAEHLEEHKLQVVRLEAKLQDVCEEKARSASEHEAALGAWREEKAQLSDMHAQQLRRLRQELQETTAHSEDGERAREELAARIRQFDNAAQEIEAIRAAAVQRIGVYSVAEETSRHAQQAHARRAESLQKELVNSAARCAHLTHACAQACAERSEACAQLAAAEDALRVARAEILQLRQVAEHGQMTCASESSKEMGTSGGRELRLAAAEAQHLEAQTRNLLRVARDAQTQLMRNLQAELRRTHELEQLRLQDAQELHRVESRVCCLTEEISHLRDALVHAHKQLCPIVDAPSLIFPATVACNMTPLKGLDVYT